MPYRKLATEILTYKHCAQRPPAWRPFLLTAPPQGRIGKPARARKFLRAVSSTGFPMQTSRRKRNMSESTLFLIVFCILVVYGFILWNLSWQIRNGIDFVRSMTRSDIVSSELRLAREMMSTVSSGSGCSEAGGMRQSTSTAPRENRDSPTSCRAPSSTGSGVTMEISNSGSSME